MGFNSAFKGLKYLICSAEVLIRVVFGCSRWPVCRSNSLRSGQFGDRIPVWRDAPCRRYHPSTLLCNDYRVSFLEGKTVGALCWPSTFFLSSSC